MLFVSPAHGTEVIVVRAWPETLCVPSQEKAAFRELIAQLELDPKCKGLPFSSFLILPFQRITRLKLLVQVQPKAQRCLCPCMVTHYLLYRLLAFWEIHLFSTY